MASLQDIGFLNLKDSQFVEDVSLDITRFQEVRNSHRVLVFPPFASYNRLLIHKVVDSDFSDLITFSVGEQFHRRTVVAFSEACYRGEKGRQLLSQPKEARSKQPNSTSKWRNLTNQERVANWVRLREIKNRKREIWNSPKVLSLGDLGQDDDDDDMSMENLSGEDVLEKAKPKKQAAAVYVPPFLRARRGNMEPQENMNTSQSSNLSSTPLEDVNNIESSSTETDNLNSKQDNVNNSTSSFSESLNSTCEENMNNSQSSFSEINILTSPENTKNYQPSVSESQYPRSQLQGVVATQEEPKRARGRGRGRRKPEIQVYVPKALRDSKQESSTPSGLLNRGEEGEPKLESVKNLVCREQDKIYNDCEEDEIEGPSVNKTDNDSEATSDVIRDSLSGQNSSVDDGKNLSSARVFPPETSDDSVKKVLSVNCTGEQNDQSGEGNLTFEFYDPAVIAFMPSPKLPQEDDPSVANVNFGNPFYSDGLSSEVQQTDELGTNSNNVKYEAPRTASVVSAPVGGDVSENASKESEQDFIVGTRCVNTPKDSIAIAETHCANTPKDSIDKNSDDAVPSKKKSKSDTKKKKTKKKRDAKSDSSTCEQGNVKESKSKTKTKSHKSSPEGEVEERLPEERQSQLQQSSADKEDDGADNGDSWDALFDDDGDCLDDSVLADITAHVGKVEIERPKIDYLSYTPKEPDTDTHYEVFNHIVEIYDFPPEFGTQDIIGAFKDFRSQGFDIKWVDDTHALGVFSSVIAAREALKVLHPMLKTRPMSEASRQGLSKAKSCQEFLQPYKERPQTTSMAARRLVAGALGMAPKMSREMREQERNKLKAAKEKRKQEKQQKVDIWDGSFGKCAMDDV